MSGPVDTKGNPLTEGTLLVYTTNERNSGLQFGTVHKIKAVDGKRWDYSGDEPVSVPVTTYKVQFLRTDVYGKPKFETEWIPEEKKHRVTDIQQNSRFVEIYAGKVLAL